MHSSPNKSRISLVRFLLLGARVKTMACCAGSNTDISPKIIEVSLDSLGLVVL